MTGGKGGYHNGLDWDRRGCNASASVDSCKRQPFCKGGEALSARRLVSRGGHRGIQRLAKIHQMMSLYSANDKRKERANGAPTGARPGSPFGRAFKNLG